MTKSKSKAFPSRGLTREEVLAHLRSLREGDMDWRAGRTWSLVYHIDEDHKQLLQEAHALFASENMLNPFAFSSLRRLEGEVIEMTIGLLNGDEQAVGTMTAGGTESLFLAVYAYREWARKHRPRIKMPELVIPATQHPAVEKAAHMLGLSVRKVPVGPDYRAVPAAMEQAVTPNTIALFASAPSFPHGLIDPVEEIGRIAQGRGLPFHVDACVGGYLLPWVEKLGYDLPRWDFRVPGVTSISADVHKNGYGAKGASVITYRSMAYLKHQFFVVTDYPGGIYIVATFLGTRSGGPVAAAWASLKSMGEDGFLDLTRRVMAGTEKMKTGLRSIPRLELVGEPDANLLAFRTIDNKPDIFVVGDQLEAKGWLVDRQQFPNCLHISVLPPNLPVIDTYLADLREAVEYALAHPGATARGNAALYGLMARIPFRGMVEKNVRKIFEDLYSREGSPTETGNSITHHPSPITHDSSLGWLNRLLVWLGRR